MRQNPGSNNFRLILSQITALREMSKNASERSEGTRSSDDIGYVLTANMLAGFALELGLKLFYWTYNESGPPNTHNLLKLFEGLPIPIQNDICSNYIGNVWFSDTVKKFAFMNSASQPDRPNETFPRRYDTPLNVIKSVSDVFTESRYFFERVSSGGWEIVDHPIRQMDHLSDILELVYREYRNRGGWSDQHFVTEDPPQ